MVESGREIDASLLLEYLSIESDDSTRVVLGLLSFSHDVDLLKDRIRMWPEGIDKLGATGDRFAFGIACRFEAELAGGIDCGLSEEGMSFKDFDTNYSAGFIDFDIDDYVAMNPTKKCFGGVGRGDFTERLRERGRGGIGCSWKTADAAKL